MPTNWPRRALLASLGSISLAGCLDRETDDTAPASSGDDSAGNGTDASDGTPSSGGSTPTPDDGPAVPERIDGEWPMPAVDAGRSNGTAESDGPTAPVAELWAVTAGASLSRPVLADETLYLGSAGGTVIALDARDGTERWRASTASAAAAPWVVDDRLLVPTDDAIVALEADDGTESWRTETPGSADVVVASHGVYWLTDSETPVVTGLSLADGEEQWETELRDPWDPHLFASEESVFVSTGTTGRIPWTLAPETGDVVGDEPRRGADFPAERFFRDGAIFGVDPFFGVVHGDGWSRGVEGVGHYALGGGESRVYYVAASGEKPGLYALSRGDGAIEWSTNVVTEVVGRPVATAASVLVRGPDTLYCFDADDGTELWSVSSSGDGGGHIVADDLVFRAQGDTVQALRSP